MPANTQVKNPDAKLPIDPDVKIPPSVAAAAAAADAAHKAAYTPEPVTVVTPVAAPVADPVADPIVPAQPAPVVLPEPSKPEDRSGVDPRSWEGRYYAMEGRFQQSMQQVGGLQQQLSEMGDELMRVNELIRMNPDERATATGQKQPGQAPRKLVTDADVQTYGPELIDFVTRAAREAIAPDLSQVSQQVRQTSQRVGQVTQSDMLVQLDTSVPAWKEINVNPRFKMWCRSPDIYSGQLRGRLLNQAFQAADTPRVVAFFKGFLAEEQATGQLPAQTQPQPQPGTTPAPAPREPAVSLDSLTAPGRPKPAGGDLAVTTADKPVFTRAQIAAFYEAVRRGHYNGRDQDKQRDEQAIFAAQREGRVRG